MKQLLVLLIVTLSAFCHAQTAVKNVDAATFKKYVDQQQTVLIDLRTPDEISRKGMIKGAQQIDFLDNNAEAAIQKLDRQKTYLIYCAGGGRSGDCSEMMEKSGFKSVINLEKGFDDWKKKGFETVQK